MPKRKSSKSKPRRDLSQLSVDEFMENEIHEGSEGRGKRAEDEQPKKKVKMSMSMSHLATCDPEFYQYLQDNDRQLLEFDDSGSEDEELVEEESDSDDGDREGGGGGGLEPVPAHITSWKEKQCSSDEESEEGESEVEGEGEGGRGVEGEEEEGIPVTVAMVQDWVDSITKAHSLAGVKQLSLALRAAVQGEGEGEGEGEERGFYRVSGTLEFNAIVVACMSHVSQCLHHHISLPHTHTSTKKPFLPSSHKNWNRLQPVVQTYCLVVLRLLRRLRNPSTVCAVLRHIRSLTSFYVSIPKLRRSLTRVLLELWEGQDQHVQVLAFLILRQITLLSPHPSLHTTLKKLYLTFVRNAKFTSLTSLPRIAFMKNCVVEMMSLDVATGYQHGFVYIRQLALHLRQAITSGKKEALQVVQCWQFVHCLDLWCQALCSLLPSPSLTPLLYPLVETTVGTLSLQPSPRTVPLRLHLTASLSKLAAATGTYIPLAPHLLEIMEAHSVQVVSGPQSAKPPELSCLLKASTSQLHSRGYQTAVLTRAFELLLQLLASQTHLIGFPEIAYPSIYRMRKMIKTTPLSWFRQQLKQLVEKVEEVSAEVTKARSHVTFTPKDTDEIGAWEAGRRERGGDTLNRFLATWQKLHPGPSCGTEATSGSDEKKDVVKDLLSED